jgi:hypothetical protein
MTLPLIDKQDSFEIIRDAIAVILATETAGQQAAATAAGKDPELWKFRVYTERANPWGQYIAQPLVDKSPIVDVWFNTGTASRGKSSGRQRQHFDGVFHIDCYGYGESADDPGGGHLPGDREAAYNSHRAARLVRNILMAGDYEWLGLRGLVGQRWVETITSFQPQQGERATQNILATRIALAASYNETTAPGDESNLLEYVSVGIKRASDGEVLATVDIDYTV